MEGRDQEGTGLRWGWGSWRVEVKERHEEGEEKRRKKQDKEAGQEADDFPLTQVQSSVSPPNRKSELISRQLVPSPSITLLPEVESRWPNKPVLQEWSKLRGIIPGYRVLVMSLK